MLWTICFILSISIVLLALCYIILSKTLINKRKKNIKVFNWLITAVFLSAGIAFYPIYDSIFEGDKFCIFKSIIL